MLALLSVAPLAALDADRDFSGRWVLDDASSRTRTLAPPDPDRLFSIAQVEMSLSCSTEPAAEPPAKWSFTADGNETKYAFGVETRSTVAKWEGAALLINTLVSGPSSYTVMDRWTLNRDRSALTIERHIVRRSGEVEGILVYRREGSLTLTTARPRPPVRILAARPPGPEPSEVVVPSGTHIPLSLLSSVSTRRSHEGDRVYLETVFPIVANGRVVIPHGSYVQGTVTQSKASGRVSGKSELYIRVDTLTLRNGTTRDFCGRLGAADGNAGTVDQQEGKVTADGDRTGDARKVGEGVAIGAAAGSIGGAVAGHPRLGLGVGAAAGAAAGLAGVLLSKGPEVVLPKGTTLEMVLDRELRFKPEELTQ
jgi:type IV secretion system protein VirB10